VEEIDEGGKKVPRIEWSDEMHEQLIEVLHQVFEDGGAADNSFKKPTFKQAAVMVRKVYNGPHQITGTKCKNKWADTKIKWGHWMFLSKQSGVGFNPDTELYEFLIYTWTSLNKSHPKIIWHKTHVMPFRDMISYILHDVQANGDSAFSLEKPTPLDPRLEAISQATSASSSPVPPTKSSKKLYSKSKGKRTKEEEDESDGGAPVPKKEKVEKLDLPTAISGFTYELTLARKAKEAFLSP
jgi:hypothetical protein